MSLFYCHRFGSSRFCSAGVFFSLTSPEERKAMLVVLRFLLCSIAPQTHRFPVAVSSCRFGNDNKHRTKWFISMTMFSIEVLPLKWFPPRPSFFFLSLSRANDKMIFHVPDEKLFFCCVITMIRWDFYDVKMWEGEKLPRLMRNILPPSQSNLYYDLSTHSRLHVIFINHNSISVYGYLCESSSE